MVFESFGKGIAAAGRIMASLFYGEEDDRSIPKVIRTMCSKGTSIMLAACAAAFLLADVAAGLFYADPASQAHKLTAMAMRYGSAVILLQAVYYIFHDYYQAIGRNTVVNIMSALEGICGTVLSFYLQHSFEPVARRTVFVATISGKCYNSIRISG